MRFFATLVAAGAAIASSGVPAPTGVEVQPQVFAGLQPQLAKLGERVFLAYGQDNAISVLSSRDGGQTFGPAITLTVPGRVSLGMHRGPRIAVTANAVMVTVVAGAKGGGVDGDLLLYRSTDGGATFAAPVVINDVPGSAREGLHAFAANDQGFVILAWLDLRDKGTRIYTAISRTHGAIWSSDELTYQSPSGSVCECCHPSVAAGRGGGGLARAIMFRNNLNGNRDMYVIRGYEGSYLPAQKQGTGSWKLDACPMDGGAVVVALNGRDAFSVWRRENDVYLTSPGRPEQRLGSGRDPVIDRSGDHQDVAWSSPKVMLLRDGGPPAPVGDGRFPAILALERRTVLAWESQGTVKVLSLAR